MSSLRLLFMTVWLVLSAPSLAMAEQTALARVDAAASAIRGGEIVLTLSQPVPWRVFLMDAPRRVVIDLEQAIWPAALDMSGDVALGAQMGVGGAGIARLVIDLAGPFEVAEAGLTTETADGRAVLRMRLQPVSPDRFASLAEADPGPLPARGPQSDNGPLLVMLDPGHGGIDPGAEAGGLTEAHLMLTFARELREVLLRSGGFAVEMTRADDVFVPLERRISIAREAGADIFISLHADALPEDAGHASGATVYTLADEASDEASQLLAERHDQSDLLAGVDLQGQEDEIALVLMDMARQVTAPRSGRLADALVTGLAAKVGPLNSKPRREAAFSVLKSPDIPSVLVELGFLSSARDRKKISDPEWRLRAAIGIRDGLRAWAEDEMVLRAIGQ